MNGGPPEEKPDFGLGAAGTQPPQGPPDSRHDACPTIPDHKLLRRIGGGSYGEVWLARNIVGTLRAVKFVYRRTFEDDRPFEREFQGIQKFEPISRSHEGFVDVLQVGQNAAAGCFYYAMELADPAGGGQAQSLKLKVQSSTPRTASATPKSDYGSLITEYCPRTLRHEIKTRGPLPPAECVAIGLTLARALGHLHRHCLVHRDIKPSNIIFIDGVPKLADIGLATDTDATRSYEGTEGFMPPEGPGTPQADLYSLGKVLYEMSTGKSRQEYPDLPTALGANIEREQFLELNEVFTKACASDPRQRYPSAEEMISDLERLQRGQSVKRKRLLERRLKVGWRSGLALVSLVLAGIWIIDRAGMGRAVGSFAQNRQGLSLARAKAEVQEAVRLYELGRFHYNRLTDEDLKKCVKYMNQAIQIDPEFTPAYVTLFEVAVWARADMPLDKRVKTEKEIAATLVDIAPTLGETHACLSWVKWNEDDAVGAEAEIRKAIGLNPNYATAHAYYGCYLVWLGRIDEAPAEFQRARELDAASAAHATVSGFPFYARRQYAEAIAQFRQALEVNPNFGWAHMWIGKALEAKGDYLAAINEYEQIDLKAGNDEAGVLRQYQALRQAFEELGPKGYWQEVLRQFQEKKTKNLLQNDRYDLVAIYARLEKKEQALEQLEKEIQTCDYDIWLKTDAAYDCLRDNPRFKALLKRTELEK